jgi:Crp-like helix-turn-helix domain
MRLRGSDRLGLPGILAMHDWAGQDVLPLTHEFLGERLGGKHSTVSAVTRTLQTAGLIQKSRGGITAIDWAGLEKTNYECYRRIRRIYQRLLPGAYPSALFR